MALEEKQIVIPALQAMAQNGGFISTSDLIEHIRRTFILDAHDCEYLDGRNDERFTQIVRNLKSHKVFVKNGLAMEVANGFRINQSGLSVLDDLGII